MYYLWLQEGCFPGTWVSSISVAAYEAKFHMLSHKKERIQLFIKNFNTDLQVLYTYMASAGKGFNEMYN